MTLALAMIATEIVTVGNVDTVVLSVSGTTMAKRRSICASFVPRLIFEEDI